LVRFSNIKFLVMMRYIQGKNEEIHLTSYKKDEMYKEEKC